METINLFGASGHSKVITDIIESQGNEVGCLYDDAPHCDKISGIPVYHTKDIHVEGPLIISIGSNLIRKNISNRFPLLYSRAISPTAIISKSASVDDGTVVMQGAIIQSNAIIGKHCIINTGASIDHECVISDYVHISPHATLCGDVKIGEGTWIGAGAIIIQGIKIGKWCTIGAGSVVIKNVPDGATVVGNPAKIIKIDNCTIS